MNRRARRAKADALDVEKLAEMLLHCHAGERRVWHVIRVPGVADEDRRHLMNSPPAPPSSLRVTRSGTD